MKQKIIFIGLSLLLCITGFFIRDFFLSIVMTYILGIKITLNNTWRLPHQSFSYILFILSLGIIPLLYLIVKKYGNLNTIFRKISALMVIIAAGLSFLFSRIFYLKLKADHLKDLLQKAEFSVDAEIPRIRFEEIYLEVFLLVGLGIGTLIALLIFRKQKLQTE